MSEEIDDCDIFEIAEELVQTLELVYDALNLIPNARIHVQGKETDIDSLQEQIFHVLREYKERI